MVMQAVVVPVSPVATAAADADAAGTIYSARSDTDDSNKMHVVGQSYTRPSSLNQTSTADCMQAIKRENK